MESDQIVRNRLRARGQNGRTAEQRLLLRLPWLTPASFRLIGGLGPRSRLRQRFMCRSAEFGLDAYNRRDLDFVVLGMRPEFEYHPDRNWVKAGLVEPCYRGPEGYRDYVATVDEVWGGENYLKPLELIDLGERIIVLAEGTMRAQASGVALGEAYAAVMTLGREGWIRLQEYYDHAEALEAAGLPR